MRNAITAIFTAFLMLSLAACSESKPKTISEISSKIREVKKVDENLVISIEQGSIFEGGNTTKKVLAGIMANFQSESFDSVTIIMVETLVDKYGKEFPEPILALNFPRNEMAKINYENVVGWTILNLAQVLRIGDYSTTIVRQECKEENNAKYAAQFCENAMRSNFVPNN
jgi:hypothetical protein